MQRPEIDSKELRWNKGVCKVRLGHSKVPCIAQNKRKERDITSAAGYTVAQKTVLMFACFSLNMMVPNNP